MITSIFIKKWISFEISSNSSFEGGLTEYNDSDDDETYEEASDGACDAYDEYKTNESEDTLVKFLTNFLESSCKMFKRLYLGGNLYIGLESGAAASVFLWTLSLIIYCNFGRGLILSYFLSCISLISHTLGIVIFIILTNTKLSSCDDFPTNGDQPELCAKTGPFISLGIFI